MLQPERKLKVLWLEDDNFEFYSELIEQFQLNHRFEIQWLTDGNQAWAALGKADPDLFIMDIIHPGLCGAIMLERLAAKKVACPILVISGCKQEIVKGFSEVRCSSLKITVLPKPFDITVLNQFLTSLADNLELENDC